MYIKYILPKTKCVDFDKENDEEMDGGIVEEEFQLPRTKLEIKGRGGTKKEKRLAEKAYGRDVIVVLSE